MPEGFLQILYLTSESIIAHTSIIRIGPLLSTAEATTIIGSKVHGCSLVSVLNF